MSDRPATTKTILIVEDDKLTAHVYSSLFKRAGYRVEHAFDGLSAIDFLEQNNPDAVLLDIMLPGKNGIEVLKAFRSKAAAKATPVTAVTNALIPHFVQAAREAGATSIFSKASVTPMELTESFCSQGQDHSRQHTELSYVPVDSRRTRASISEAAA
ncbi:MAG: Response regulator with CheY-like protein receiver domain and winged-helix DNA-binding protein [Verrucomicrobiales bacterium]|nr:Response regulator with CheY-like protein receiver domain and winged-helix DNA-binding protein [Verrucomicrobiales bacterium]